MPDLPSVSVVIPTFNKADRVSDAIKSVLAQDYSGRVELIIVNDGSTDATKRTLEQYSEHSNIRIIHQDNGGPSAARNTGIRLAASKYIAFLDDDDLWLPFKLSVQLQYLERRESIGACYSNAFNYDQLENTVRTRYPARSFREGDLFKSFLLRRIHVVPSTLVIRRSALTEVGLYEPELRRSEDREFMMRLSKRVGIGGIKEALAVVRLHNAINPKPKEDVFGIEYYLKVEERLREVGRGLCTSRWQRLHLDARTDCLIGLRYLNHHNSYRKGIGFILRSLLKNPLDVRSWRSLLLSHLFYRRGISKKLM